MDDGLYDTQEGDSSQDGYYSDYDDDDGELYPTDSADYIGEVTQPESGISNSPSWLVIEGDTLGDLQVGTTAYFSCPWSIYTWRKIGQKSQTTMK